MNFSQFGEQQVRRMFDLTQKIKENLLADWKAKAETTVIESEEQKVLN